MDNKSDLFDLKREKQELDSFLSTIAGTDAPSVNPAKNTVPVQEPIPVQEVRQEEDIPVSEVPRPRPLASAPKLEEAFIQPAYHEKPEPQAADIKPVKPIEEEEIKLQMTSSFLPPVVEKKEEPLPKILDIQESREPERPRAPEPSYRDSFEEEAKSQPLPPEEKPLLADIEQENKTVEEALYETAPEEKKSGKGKRTGLLILLVIALMAGAFWMYSGQVMNSAKSIPGVGSLIRSIVSVEKDVNLINVRQRLMENKKTGKSMRVIEGTASNVSSQTISNIKIAAKLQDASGSELIMMESIAGNVLTDEKLENLDAGAIKAALLTARGPVDKIPPRGQIPFMIVFTGEPAGVFKMSVTPVDFTKQ